MSTGLIWAVESDAKVSQRTVMIEMENMEKFLPLKQNTGRNIDTLWDTQRKSEIKCFVFFPV